MARKSIIAAFDKEQVIGHKNDLPWRGQLRHDMERFKELTIGHTVIMGRVTHDSIGRPLPNRRNIVITGQQDLEIPGCDVVHSLEDAYELGADDSELFIIGGAKIYHLALLSADRLLITEIDAEFEGDTYFPEISEAEWHKVSEDPHTADELNQYNYTFIEYERIK